MCTTAHDKTLVGFLHFKINKVKLSKKIIIKKVKTQPKSNGYCI